METYENYKQVLCYTLFAALYMLVLYYQVGTGAQTSHAAITLIEIIKSVAVTAVHL